MSIIAIAGLAMSMFTVHTLYMAYRFSTMTGLGVKHIPSVAYYVLKNHFIKTAPTTLVTITSEDVVDDDGEYDL